MSQRRMLMLKDAYSIATNRVCSDAEKSETWSRRRHPHTRLNVNPVVLCQKVNHVHGLRAREEICCSRDKPKQNL